MSHEREINALLAGDVADASMVGRIRLVLAASGLLTVFINGGEGIAYFTWLVFGGYTAHSLVLYVLSQMARPFLQSKLIHWLDVFWYALIIPFAGGSGTFVFLYFFFAILTASFRWGFEEGARVTLASTALFVVTAALSESGSAISWMLLRTIFLLALGYMIAYWGEAEVVQKGRLTLLRNVSLLSNPRFGVEHTIASLLEKTRAFFKANSCILLMKDTESATWTLYTATEVRAGHPINAERISDATAAAFMVFPQDQTVLYTRSFWPRFMAKGALWTLDHAQVHWYRHAGEPGESLAELLEARSFIAVPLALRKGEGSIYITSPEHDFSKADALFLNHVAAQAFPVIENIELLDRLASEAALRERQKIALDLHDTAIQPYIGLKHGLSALRNKATTDNPLLEDIDKLSEMATRVIGDLRHFARTFKEGSGLSEPLFLSSLRRQVAQIREFYGINIAVNVEGTLDISDRLAAEVFQIINEGLSNIRKHTNARRGFIALRCENGRLNIAIGSESLRARTAEFIPRSINERAAALGGKSCVESQKNGNTVVYIEIPI